MNSLVIQDEDLFIKTENELWVYIFDIVNMIGLNVRNYRMFQDTCGMGWVIEKIASDIYLSNIIIDENVRRRIKLILLIDHANSSYYNILYKINGQLKKRKIINYLMS